MKNVIATVACVTYMIACVAPALAAAPIAEASGLQGKVLVNHGKGFVPAQGSVLLNAGDKLMVGANSSANINYLTEKCLVSANASSVVTVTASAPCKSGLAVGSVDNVFAVPVAVTGPGFPILPVVLIGGAVVVGGGILIVTKAKKKCNGVSAC